MERNDAGYIIGAYPCAPSFHQKSEQEETEFWRLLADTPTSVGSSSHAMRTFTPMAMSGCSSIRRRSGRWW